MNNKIICQQYDNNIKLLFKIRKDGLLEPLTNAIVWIKFKGKKTGIEFDRRATISDANTAECEYTLTEEDLSVVDGFVTEVETTYQNGTVLSQYNPFLLMVQKEIHNRTEK